MIFIDSTYVQATCHHVSQIALISILQIYFKSSQIHSFVLISFLKVLSWQFDLVGV